MLLRETIVCCNSYRGMQKQTEQCLKALTAGPDGAEMMTVTGCPDLAEARSLLLTRAMDRAKARAFGKAPATLLLIVDDDMVFSREQALELLTITKVVGHPTSGVYSTSEGRLAAQPWSDLPKRWLAGFGFMAVPIAKMREVEESLPLLQEGDHQIRMWCGSGENPKRPGIWCIDDYWFCLHFDGVRLSPIGVGHIKTVPLYPSDETLKLIAQDREDEMPSVRLDMTPLEIKA